MKKLLKKSTAVLLAAIMMMSLFTIMPFSANAASSDENEAMNGALEFNGHYYKVFLDNEIGWHEAVEVCKSYGGHLVTITSEEENNFVYDLVSPYGVSCWAGGTDEDNEGEWKWVTGEEWSYSLSDFNNCNGKQHYLVINYNNKINWDDQSEKGDSFLCNTGGYICEWDYADTTQYDSNKTIAVFSTEKSLTVKTGESMRLAFGLLDNNTGELDGDWKKMAVTVSDSSKISLSDYELTDYGYSIDVKGNKEGLSNMTITDTDSGISRVITIKVSDTYSKSYSYDIENMVTFYPENKWENNIATNIYNLNGLYVNNYSCEHKDNKYIVSFDVYNERYHTGAVDIYDGNGNWIDCEEIKKNQQISSLWDTGEQAYYLISDLVTGKMITYEQASFAKHTHIDIEVPEGGYFTISNNCSVSPGTFLFNASEILYDGVCTLIDLATADSVDVSEFSKLIKDDVVYDEPSRKEFYKIFINTASSEVRTYTKNILLGNIDDACAGISGLLENMLSSLDIKWKHLFKSVTGVGESAFEKFAGPAGVALKGCFAITKSGNKLLQVTHLAKSIDAVYATVYSSIDEGYINPYGVIVDTNGNMDPEAVLQVFRVSNDDTLEVILNSDDPLEKYELYNVSFVKNDQNVQPNGKVTVRIPVPDGMKGDTCKVYRQENDGGWTIIDAHVEGNYLVFETDHFSLYAIFSNNEELSISSLPSKVNYSKGEILNTEGLTLKLNNKSISDGFICDPMVLSETGTQTITVTYGTLTAEFEVYVSEANAFTVTATSNIASPVSEIYSKDDKTVTVTYYLKTEEKITSGVWYINYDPTILKPSETLNVDKYGDADVMPIISGAIVNLHYSDYQVHGNFSEASTYYDSGYDFSNNNLKNNPFISITFDIVGDYTEDTEINLNVEYLDWYVVKYEVDSSFYSECETLTELRKEPYTKKLQGDVNGDGGLNIKDAAAIQLWLAKLYTEEFDESIADVNGDGDINISDAAYIQLKLANLLK